VGLAREEELGVVESVSAGVGRDLEEESAVAGQAQVAEVPAAEVQVVGKLRRGSG
jgi:hypothetical protein